jgi:hypothetical protein
MRRRRGDDRLDFFLVDFAGVPFFEVVFFEEVAEEL